LLNIISACTLIFHDNWLILSGIEAKTSKAVILGKLSTSCFKSHWAVARNVNKIASKIYSVQLVKACFSRPSLILPISDKVIRSEKLIFSNLTDFIFVLNKQKYSRYKISLSKYIAGYMKTDLYTTLTWRHNELYKTRTS
jgi:hypothetical protein